MKAGEIKEITEKDVPGSKYADRQAEGIVLKKYKRGIFAKFVTDDFKEINTKTFGGTPKYGKGDDAKFALKYCTNARIEKIIFKMIDEGFELDISMMKHLPFRVYQDIFEENLIPILKGNMRLDFRKVRQLISRRCLNVLKQVMVNNALNS